MQHGVDDVLLDAAFTPEAMTLSCESHLGARRQGVMLPRCSFPGIGFCNPRLSVSLLLS